jgi:hypothetical protein
LAGKPNSGGKIGRLTVNSETDYILSTAREIMSANIKEEARRLVEALPDDSTWEDLMYQIHVRQTIELGLADSEAGRVTGVEKVREEFGLPV